MFLPETRGTAPMNRDRQGRNLCSKISFSKRTHADTPESIASTTDADIHALIGGKLDTQQDELRSAIGGTRTYDKHQPSVSFLPLCSV